MGTNIFLILLVEDDSGDAELLYEMLGQVPNMQFDITHVTRLSEGEEKVREEPYDIILLDLALPDSQGLDTVRTMVQAAPNIPIVVLTGLDDDQTGLEALRNGAQDFLVKGQADSTAVTRAMRFAIQRQDSTPS
jgi:DNA-binding response OmpR family regulator